MFNNPNNHNEAFQPMFTQLRPESPFPQFALPDDIQSTVGEAFEITKAPGLLIVSTILGTMSLAIQGLAEVSVGENRPGNCGIFILVIADPSEGKTSCERLFFKPFYDWEEREAERAKVAHARYLAEHNTWKATVKHIKSAISAEVKNHATF